MRILHIIDTLNPAAGGPATVIARLAAAQAALGHQVTILSYLDPSEKGVIEKNLQGIPGVSRVQFEFLQTQSSMELILLLNSRERVWELVCSASMVHLHGVWEPLLRIAAQYARKRHVPYVVRPAGMLDPWSLGQRWFKKFLAMWLGGYRKMFNHCAFMHTLNHDEERLIQRLNLRCPMEVIPNGVFPQEFDDLPPAGSFRRGRPELRDDPFVLFLSRLHFKKGLDYLADGFAVAAQKNSRLRLVVAGPEGGARADFVQRIGEAGLSDRVHLVGPLYGDEKSGALVDAEMFCLPSRQEGFSLAITEALASGQPVIISPECHFPEVAECGAGRVVENNPATIGEAMLEIAGDPSLRQSMSQAGKRLIRERFTWPQIARTTVDGYNRAFGRQGSPFSVKDPQRLHIIHVISSLAVEAGGPPVVCAGLAGAQAAMGHRVTIAAVGLPDRKRVTIPAGVEVVDFPITGLERYASSPQLDKWLAENGPQADFFHLHSVWQFPTFAAARLCWKHRKPYVVLLNGMLDKYSVRHRNLVLKRMYWKLREGRILGRAQALHCLNMAEIKNAISWIAEMPKFVCGNGINASQFDHMPEKGRFRAANDKIGTRPLALFMSRVHPKKGLDRLIPAWKNVLEKSPDCVLAIAGSGDADYVATIDKLIADTGLGQRVIRVGQLSGAAKWEAIVDADLFVLPSHQEGFSMAITEALAAAVPVVATVECNYGQLTSDQCGIEIAHGDMNAFAAALCTLLADPARRARMGASGRDLVRTRFTWEGIVGDLQRVYEWIIAGKPLPIDGTDVWRDPVAPESGAVDSADAVLQRA